MPIPLKPFYMIRHGQTEANALKVMAGSTDSPLTATGIAQAHRAKDVTAALQIKPTAIFHSHLSRARDTAAIINQALDIPIYEDPDLAEIHAGDFEGRPYDQCKHIFNSWPTITNGETPQEFFNRVKRGKSRAIDRFNDPVLIVCHGGVMRAFGALYKLHVPGRFENAHLYEFIPNLKQSHFPWDVFDYKLCENTKTLIKSKSTIYDDDSADKIA